MYRKLRYRQLLSVWVGARPREDSIGQSQPRIGVAFALHFICADKGMYRAVVLRAFQQFFKGFF